MKTKRLILLFICVVVFIAAVSAQNGKNEEDEILRIETQLVDVPFVVADKAGKPVLNLKKENFIVYEDGKRQEVAEFAAAAAPFEIALLLDTSGSTREDLPLIRRAAESFIASLRPGDRVSIIAYESRVIDNRSTALSEVLIGLTDDRTKLKAALAEVKTSYGTPYYDSLDQIAEEVFNQPPKDEFRGRRALVALSDGVDSTSVTDFEEAREKMARAGVAAYFIQIDTREAVEERLLGDCGGETIRFSRLQLARYYRGFGAKARIEKISDFCLLGDFERLAVSKSLYETADAEMRDMAKISGGKVFPVADLSQARSAFRKVADEIGTKYSLGYYSSNEKRDGTYRTIKIELKGVPAGAQIRAREGYTAPTN